MAAPVSNPPTTRNGNGHHAGTVINPSAAGSVSNNRCRPWLIAHKNQYAAAEMVRRFAELYEAVAGVRPEASVLSTQYDGRSTKVPGPPPFPER